MCLLCCCWACSPGNVGVRTDEYYRISICCVSKNVLVGLTWLLIIRLFYDILIIAAFAYLGIYILIIVPAVCCALVAVVIVAQKLKQRWLYWILLFVMLLITIADFVTVGFCISSLIEGDGVFFNYIHRNIKDYSWYSDDDFQIDSKDYGTTHIVIASIIIIQIISILHDLLIILINSRSLEYVKRWPKGAQTVNPEDPERRRTHSGRHAIIIPTDLKGTVGVTVRGPDVGPEIGSVLKPEADLVDERIPTPIAVPVPPPRRTEGREPRNSTVQPPQILQPNLQIPDDRSSNLAYPLDPEFVERRQPYLSRTIPTLSSQMAMEGTTQYTNRGFQGDSYSQVAHLPPDLLPQRPRYEQERYNSREFVSPYAQKGKESELGYVLAEENEQTNGPRINEKNSKNGIPQSEFAREAISPFSIEKPGVQFRDTPIEQQPEARTRVLPPPYTPPGFTKDEKQQKFNKADHVYPQEVTYGDSGSEAESEDQKSRSEEEVEIQEFEKKAEIHVQKSEYSGEFLLRKSKDELETRNELLLQQSEYQNRIQVRKTEYELETEVQKSETQQEIEIQKLEVDNKAEIQQEIDSPMEETVNYWSNGRASMKKSSKSNAEFGPPLTTLRPLDFTSELPPIAPKPLPRTSRPTLTLESGQSVNIEETEIHWRQNVSERDRVIVLDETERKQEEVKVEKTSEAEGFSVDDFVALINSPVVENEKTEVKIFEEKVESVSGIGITSNKFGYSADSEYRYSKESEHEQSKDLEHGYASVPESKYSENLEYTYSKTSEHGYASVPESKYSENLEYTYSKTPEHGYASVPEFEYSENPGYKTSRNLESKSSSESESASSKDSESSHSSSSESEHLMDLGHRDLRASKASSISLSRTNRDSDWSTDSEHELEGKIHKVSETKNSSSLTETNLVTNGSVKKENGKHFNEEVLTSSDTVSESYMKRYEYSFSTLQEIPQEEPPRPPRPVSLMTEIPLTSGARFSRRFDTVSSTDSKISFNPNYQASPGSLKKGAPGESSILSIDSTSTTDSRAIYNVNYQPSPGSRKSPPPLVPRLTKISQISEFRGTPSTEVRNFQATSSQNIHFENGHCHSSDSDSSKCDSESD
ncbi:hypothetical protein FO519_005133 [Halicephalobus sp. NKZ332]|nr:hypothetical protein FO519_005133 [Halicephalobus sp. NKZ332]